jgi:hypothetical protein
MDASLRVAVERLYSKLRNTLALIDGMHRVRLGPPGCIGEKPEEIGPAFWREFDTCGNSFASLCKTLVVAHDESKAIVQTEAVASIVFQTVARQSLAFKPAKATTFCGEAIERLRSLMLFYHRLLNRMNFAKRSDSDMLRLYHESESLWDVFGFSQGDFDELHRGLAWEFATVCDMQNWNVNENPIIPREDVSSLPKAIRLAYLAAAWAEAKEGRQLTDREAWTYLRENGIENAEGLDSYQLPMQDTFADYLNRARRSLGEKRKTPRGGRTGRSAIRHLDSD